MLCSRGRSFVSSLVLRTQRLRRWSNSAISALLWRKGAVGLQAYQLAQWKVTGNLLFEPSHRYNGSFLLFLRFCFREKYFFFCVQPCLAPSQTSALWCLNKIYIIFSKKKLIYFRLLDWNHPFLVFFLLNHFFYQLTSSGSQLLAPIPSSVSQYVHTFSYIFAFCLLLLSRTPDTHILFGC